jgi:hypothetical protein
MHAYLWRDLQFSRPNLKNKKVKLQTSRKSYEKRLYEVSLTEPPWAL